MRLDFICVGAQKAGTTTLHHILKEHPDIYLPENKEAHFFDQEERYAKGLDWWEQTFFKSYSEQMAKGVFTPEYLYFSEVPGRIYNDLGKDVKIIAILRNPVERAFSHYLMSRRRAYEPLSFEEAIKAEKQRIPLGFFERNHFSYMDRGLYAQQLARYYALFKKEQILVLNFEEEIIQNLNRTISKLEAFLGIPGLPLNTDIKSNSASEPRSMELVKMIRRKNRVKTLAGKVLPKRLKRRLVNSVLEMNLKEMSNKPQLDNSFRKELLTNYFEEDIAELEQITGMNFSNWMN